MTQSPKFSDDKPTGEIVIYQTDDGRTKIEVRFVNETVWLSLDQMAMLFGVDKSGISRHLRNVISSGELLEEGVVAIFATTAADGKTYQVKHYNIDAIIAVGYRVNSKRATQFRIWATSVLKEYIIKGFALNDERMKTGRNMTYFDELQERIRELAITSNGSRTKNGSPAWTSWNAT